jgi:hypothetical protein
MKSICYKTIEKGKNYTKGQFFKKVPKDKENILLPESITVSRHSEQYSIDDADLAAG